MSSTNQCCKTCKFCWAGADPAQLNCDKGLDAAPENCCFYYEETQVKKMTGEDMFNAFWSAYPKKVAKPKAKKAFEIIKVDEKTLRLMISAIENSKKNYNWMKDNGQFIPYPATWLNQRRWEDEVDGEHKSVNSPTPEYTSHSIVI